LGSGVPSGSRIRKGAAKSTGLDRRAERGNIERNPHPRKRGGKRKKSMMSGKTKILENWEVDLRGGLLRIRRKMNWIGEPAGTMKSKKLTS